MSSSTTAAQTARAAAHKDRDRAREGDMHRDAQIRREGAGRADDHKHDAASLDSGEDGEDSGEDREDTEDEEDDEDDEEEEENDDDEDEQEEDAESEDVEEEPVEEESHGFDEKFLAQLMAMDQMFSTGTTDATRSDSQQSTAQPPAAEHATAAQQFSIPFLTGTQPFDSASAPQNTLSATSAPTPSNEFYDGAINFLTEVLGSSNPNLFNTAGTPSQGWTPNYVPLTTGASPAPTATQFKNLQPLITNLIARLKGQPVEGSTQPHRISEEDLVVLLQSLMTQRQTQLEKKAAGVVTWPVDPQLESAFGQPGGTYNLDGNIGLSSSAAPGALDTLLPAPAQAGLLQQGQSIVDFDFGDDDDDPDFVPTNWNLGYGNQADFAQALASVASNGSLVANKEAAGKAKDISDEDCWQKVLDEFAPASGEAQSSRRTRTTSKDVGATKEASSSTQDARDASSEATEDESKTAGQSKRRKYTEEEALERRRKVNRDCARRNRERKKQEAEELRLELERIEKLRAEGQLVDSKAVSLTAPLLRTRKPGRPPGAKNRHDDEEKAPSAEPESGAATEPKVDYEEFLDMRAENRMLRADKQRLTEENAQLRATIMRYSEVIDASQPTDMRKRKRDGQYTFLDEDDEDEQSRANLLAKQNKAAEAFLAYNPFRDVQPEATSAAGRDRAPRSRPRPHSELERTSSAPNLPREPLSDRRIADVAAELVSNPKAVERLVATLKQQSSGGAASSRQRRDEADDHVYPSRSDNATSRRGHRRSPSPGINSYEARYDYEPQHSSNAALHTLLRAAAATEHT